MDNQRSPLMGLAYFFQGKNLEELRHTLLCTTLELEQTKVAVQEELKKRDDQLIHLKDFLNKVMKERDEAKEKYKRLLLEQLLIQQQQQQTPPLSTISSIEDEPRRGIDSSNAFSSSDCEESIVSSPAFDPIPPPPPQLTPQPVDAKLVSDKALPEKGKLLQAVMKAGPLLQTLLLAGPLPQWRHPPPPLQSSEIPPVIIPSPPPLPAAQLLHIDSGININGCNTTNCGTVNRKRSICEGSVSPTEIKYQKLAPH